MCVALGARAGGRRRKNRLWGFGGLAQYLHFPAIRERLMMLLNATLLLKQTKYISVVRAYGTLFGPEPCLLRAKDSTS